jgi:prepilin-type N-terminal cleavage/methylation domain-containing protein
MPGTRKYLWASSSKMNIQHQESRNKKRGARRASGFTLVEIMVVLAIMAVVAALTLGTFRSLTDNNQRTGCQTNLAQVYQGLRLYMSDENQQPPLYFPAAAAGQKNIGLWNLWTFPGTATTANPEIADNPAPVGEAPVGRYLRAPKVLHCPSDTELGTEVRTNIELYKDPDKKEYNRDFLSYQMFSSDNPYSSEDKTADITTDVNRQTYLPMRYPDPGTTDEEKLRFKRQLRQPTPGTPTQRPLNLCGARRWITPW